MYTWLRDYFWGERAYLTYWYAFLLSFSFSWRKVFIPSVTGGPFNEYMDISFYIGDILILSSLLLIIKHNLSIKSILDKIKMFHVEHKVLVLFGYYLLISIIWSENISLWLDGLTGFIRIVTILAIFVFSLKDKNCSTWNNFKYFIFILSFISCFQSVIGISQFIQNESLGINFIGESIIGESIPGIAKIDFDDYKQVRAYGTFLHPNIFGGFLVMSIVFSLLFMQVKHKKLFHVEQLFLFTTILLAFLALFLTFSKGSIVSLIVVLSIYLFHVEQNKVNKLFHVEQFILIVGVIGLTTIVFLLGKYQIIKSIEERMFLWNVNRPQGEEILIGKGLGQSTYDLSFNSSLDFWQLQPIHNTYLNIVNDIGIIGLGIIFLLFYHLWKNVPRGTKWIAFLPLGILGVIGMFDHYLWDIYVGQVLIALSIGWAITSTQFIYIDKYYKL